MVVLTEVFLVPTEEGLFDRLHKIGTEEFGLVAPKPVLGSSGPLFEYNGIAARSVTSSPEVKQYYLWQETSDTFCGIENMGYYSVLCNLEFNKIASTLNEPFNSGPLVPYDRFWFRYRADRLNEKILREDPMKLFLERTLAEAKEHITLLHVEKPLEQAVLEIERWKKSSRTIEI